MSRDDTPWDGHQGMSRPPALATGIRKSGSAIMTHLCKAGWEGRVELA